MPEFQNQRKRRASWMLLGRCVVSFVSVVLTHSALYFVPYFFPSSSLLTLLFLSALGLLAVAVLGRCFKRLLRVRASAPAFVFFNILFIWCVHIAVVRQAISPLMDVVFNAELLMLVIGLYSIFSSDPGFVACGSTSLDQLVNGPVSDVEANAEELEPSTYGVYHDFPNEEISVSVRRVRYCRHCKVYVKGFDHHCPAFGNCIDFFFLDFSHHKISDLLDKNGRETSLSGNLAISTMLFSLIQILWQGVFLTWHVYCVCFNIKTDEWIHWKRYPEFQLVVLPQPGQPFTETRFTNPYNKGILRNVKEFLTAAG